jgi:hypothetical protein
MRLSVKEKAEYLGVFRWMEVFLMETLASWVPTTPEMEMKVLFGRHVWELAQNADGLGKRTFEMRAPLHYTVRPLDNMASLLERLRELQQTGDRVHVFYDAVVPAMVEGYRGYLERTDPLLDEPSVRVIERILNGYARTQRERDEFCNELATQLKHDQLIEDGWKKHLSTVGEFVPHGAEGALARAS